jgi:hypothetical protein
VLPAVPAVGATVTVVGSEVGCAELVDVEDEEDVVPVGCVGAEALGGVTVGVPCVPTTWVATLEEGSVGAVIEGVVAPTIAVWSGWGAEAGPDEIVVDGSLAEVPPPALWAAPLVVPGVVVTSVDEEVSGEGATTTESDMSTDEAMPWGWDASAGDASSAVEMSTDDAISPEAAGVELAVGSVAAGVGAAGAGVAAGTAGAVAEGAGAGDPNPGGSLPTDDSTVEGAAATGPKEPCPVEGPAVASVGIVGGLPTDDSTIEVVPSGLAALSADVPAPRSTGVPTSLCTTGACDGGRNGAGRARAGTDPTSLVTCVAGAFGAVVGVGALCVVEEDARGAAGRFLTMLFTIGTCRTTRWRGGVKGAGAW